MVIGFKKQFVAKIKAGTKCHTIREDKRNRWKAGMKMHMATGVRTKNYKQFCETLTCISIQKIQIIYYDSIMYHYAEVFIDGNKLSQKKVNELAINDGFKDEVEFFKWFTEDFKGKIIHWTNKKY